MPSVRARGTERTERDREGVGEHKCCTGSPSGGSTGFTAVYWAVLGAAVQWICPAYQRERERGREGVEVGVDINVRVCQSGQSLHVGNCIKPTGRTDGHCWQTGHGGLSFAAFAAFAACDSNNFKMFEKRKTKSIEGKLTVVSKCSCSALMQDACSVGG